MTTIERCWCCWTERTIVVDGKLLVQESWPSVSAPGAWPGTAWHQDKLCLCPDCHAKVAEPIVFAGDLERQLGFVPRIFVDFDVDKTAPFWDEFKRAREVK